MSAPLKLDLTTENEKLSDLDRRETKNFKYKRAVQSRLNRRPPG